MGISALSHSSFSNPNSKQCVREWFQFKCTHSVLSSGTSLLLCVYMPVLHLFKLSYIYLDSPSEHVVLFSFTMTFRMTSGIREGKGIRELIYSLKAAKKKLEILIKSKVQQLCYKM